MEHLEGGPPADKLSTHFVDQGTLIPPGPVGRLVRFALAMLTLSPVISIAPQFGQLLAEPDIPTHPSWWLAVALGLWLFPYVVNIGFTVNWRWWPRAAVGVVLAGSVVLTFALTGATWSPVAGAVFGTWIIYTFGHLGLSFLIASMIATPGCEMRAVPHLWTVLSGRSTREHYCPGAMDPLDRWERQRRTAT